MSELIGKTEIPAYDRRYTHTLSPFSPCEKMATLIQKRKKKEEGYKKSNANKTPAAARRRP